MRQRFEALSPLEKCAHLSYNVPPLPSITRMFGGVTNTRTTRHLHYQKLAMPEIKMKINLSNSIYFLPTKSAAEKNMRINQMPWFHCVNWKSILRPPPWILKTRSKNLSKKNVFCIARGFDFSFVLALFILLVRSFVCVLFLLHRSLGIPANVPEMDADAHLYERERKKKCSKQIEWKEKIGEYWIWMGILWQHITTRRRAHKNT